MHANTHLARMISRLEMPTKKLKIDKMLTSVRIWLQEENCHKKNEKWETNALSVPTFKPLTNQLLTNLDTKWLSTLTTMEGTSYLRSI